jgi:hypothetical protein
MVAWVGMAANPIVSSSSLGEEFASMPLDLGGRGFGSRRDALAEKSAGPGNWTFMIWDLIDTAANHAFDSTGLGKVPRWVGNVITESAGFGTATKSEFQALIRNVEADPDPPGEWVFDDEEGGGFGVILLRTQLERSQ